MHLSGYVYIYIYTSCGMTANCSNVKFVGLLVLWHGVMIPELRTLRNSRQVSPSHSLHQLLHETVQATLLQTSNTMGDKLPHWHLGFLLLTILHGPPFDGEKNMHYADAELFGIA